MRDLIEQALKGHDAEYVEVRLEDSSTTRIQYRGRDLEEISKNSSKGGCVRALVKGGWGFVSFNEVDDLKEKVALAVRQARLVGNETSHFSETEPVEDVVEGGSYLLERPGHRSLRAKRAYPRRSSGCGRPSPGR